MKNKFEIPGFKPFKQGKVRDLYRIPELLPENTILSVTTDRISAYDEVIGTVDEKGIVLNNISNFWKIYFEQFILNDLYPIKEKAIFNLLNICKDPSDLFKRSILVKEVNPLPFEFIIRGCITGGLFEEYKNNNCCEGYYLFDHFLPGGLREGDKLPYPIFTPSTKADQGHDVNVSFWHVADKLGRSQAESIRLACIAMYLLADEYLVKRGVKIADTKFELGYITDPLDNNILCLIDEVLTPDSSRFWDLNKYVSGKPQESFDKQPFRNWLKKTGWNGTTYPPEIPQSVKTETINRYKEIEKRIFLKL